MPHQDDEPRESEQPDHELPDEWDMDDPDEPDVEDCPHCGEPIAEDAEWCHHCGKYLSREDAPSRIPAWVYFVVGAVLLAVLMWSL
jgi:predicted nucleic acid-binding Zn ribbon protein